MARNDASAGENHGLTHPGESADSPPVSPDPLVMESQLKNGSEKPNFTQTHDFDWLTTFARIIGGNRLSTTLFLFNGRRSRPPGGAKRRRPLGILRG